MILVELKKEINVQYDICVAKNNQDDLETMAAVVTQEKKVKKTIEDMMYEPMPIFDCMYCVTNSARIFKKVSENILSAKYAPIMLKESLKTYKIKQINRNEEFIKF